MAKLTKEKIKGCVQSSALTIATLCGVIGGIVLGITLKSMKGNSKLSNYGNKYNIYCCMTMLFLPI